MTTSLSRQKHYGNIMATSRQHRGNDTTPTTSLGGQQYYAGNITVRHGNIPTATPWQQHANAPSC